MIYDFDYRLLSGENKTHFREQQAVFIMAPRSISPKRLSQLIKSYLNDSAVIVGISKEPFITGLELQPQFAMMPLRTTKSIVNRIQRTKPNNQLSIVSYHQVEITEVLRLIRPNKLVAVRGSYYHAFHLLPTYEFLTKRHIPYELVSPFTDENEAIEYLNKTTPELPIIDMIRGDERAMLKASDEVAKRSFDYSYQTGAILAEQTEDGSYDIIDGASNDVVPYQTYAMHFGNTREENLSTYQDGTHYDTIHAEMNIVTRALARKQSLDGKSLFVNLMPCPNCSRTLCYTGLKEIIYMNKHSGDYAKQLFKKTDISTRRIDR
ncbi:hypothetical protein EOM60_05015 [Candidatus Saccharibacteria bacterium]|nr:hypothetical protein [Candidatus Saccharibacteria bacterium]